MTSPNLIFEADVTSTCVASEIEGSETKGVIVSTIDLSNYTGCKYGNDTDTDTVDPDITYLDAQVITCTMDDTIIVITPVATSGATATRYTTITCATVDSPAERDPDQLEITRIT